MADEELKDLDIYVDEEVEETEELDDQPEQDAPEEPESDEVDIVFEGDDATEQAAQKQKTVTLPASKLAKLRESRREDRAEKERLQQELEQLRQQVTLAPPKQHEAAMPTLAGCDYDETAYAEKLNQWQQAQVQKQLQTYHQSLQQKQAQEAQAREAEQRINAHYDRAASLQVPDYEDAERAVRDTLGGDLTDLMIARLGDGSEKMVYHLGKRPERVQELIASLQTDPSGLDAMMKLGEWRTKLVVKPKTKTISSAPAADEALGGRTGQSEAALLKQLEKLDGRTDRSEYRKLRNQLVSAGKSELLRKHGYM